MRSAKSLFGQSLINRAVQMAVAKIEQFDAAPDFGFAQKKRRRALALRGRDLDSHIDVSRVIAKRLARGLWESLTAKT
jgi:hypothetical protein